MLYGMERRALRRDSAGITVLREQRIPLEADMQKAFVDHPEALPASDLNLGPLTSLAWELDLGAGPMDQLAVDPRGQLVIVEYKKGTENPDVRKVVAQLLHYGSALWRTSLEELRLACQDNGECTLVNSQTEIADHVAALTDAPVDREQFDRTIRACLEDGTFVFLYVVRDLDPITRGVLAYLSDGAGLRFYAVEVDWFGADDGTTVIVPRIAFVPAKVAAGDQPAAPTDPYTDDLIARVDLVAERSNAIGQRAETGRRWSVDGEIVLGVYRSSMGLSIGLPEFQRVASRDAADAIRTTLQELFPQRKLPPQYPSFAPSDFVAVWDRGGEAVIARLLGA